MRDHGSNLAGAWAVGVRDLMGDAMVDATGMDATAVAALTVVRARPGQTITDLAFALEITHSGAVRVIDRCVSRRLLERCEGRDGRSRGLALTVEGEAVADRALAARERALDGLLDVLEAGDRSIVVASLARMLAVLPGDRRDAWRVCRWCDHTVCRGASCPVGDAVDRRADLVP